MRRELSETILWCYGENERMEDCCEKIDPLLDRLDDLEATAFKTASYKIKCSCMKGNYKKAISIAKENNEEFWVASLHYFYVDKPRGENMLWEIHEKYKAQEYLEEVELGIYLRTLTLLDIEMSFETFVEHVKQKELRFENEEQLLIILDSIPTKEEVKKGLCRL